MCATFVPIVYFLYPETAGKSLEEIDAIFTESKSIFETVQVAKGSVSLVSRSSGVSWNEERQIECLKATKEQVA